MDQRIRDLLPEAAVDGPWRVDSYGAKVTFVRGKSAPLELDLLRYRLLRLHFSANHSEGWRSLSYGLDKLRKQPNSVDLVMFNRAGILTELLEGFRRPKLPQHAIDSLGESSLATILSELLGHGEAKLQEASTRGLLWPTNAKYSFAVIPHWREDYADPRAIELLMRLSQIAGAAKLNLLLLGDAELPEEIESMMDWECSIGTGEALISEDLHILGGSPKLEVIGKSLDRVAEPPELREVHSLRYMSSKAAADDRSMAMRESKAYADFLAKLTDGTDGR